MSPVELQTMCERAVEARTREIVAFLRKQPGFHGRWYAAEIEREYLADEIAPAEVAT